MTTDEFLSLLEAVRRNGNGWQARCPAHNDHKPSLSVDEGVDGRILVYCHAECSFEQVCAALKIDSSSLSPNGHARSARAGREATSERPRIAKTYDYLDENRQLLYQVCRTEPKGFF